MELKAGQIVTVDWRKEPDDPAQDPQPPEPNKLRPAVVVQDTELFDPAYPTVLVVPMTGDPALAIPELTVVLQPFRQPEAPLCWPQPMTVNRESLDKLGRFLLRNDWTGSISAGVAWLVFLQVERRLAPPEQRP